MVAAPVPALLDDVAELMVQVIESLGYVGIAALVALETVVPPIPSELILPLAGFMAGQGRFWLPGVIVAATTGSVVGALALYGLGAWLGEARLRRLVERFERVLRVSGHDLDRANEWFDRHGGAAVLIGRVVPVVRSLISIPAGLRRMPLWRFVAYTAAGSAVWNSLLVGLGWVLGDRWHQVDEHAHYVEWAVLAALAGGVGWFFWKRRAATKAE
jgi:membrane protein DedA with SNARE-associated domain